MQDCIADTLKILKKYLMSNCNVLNCPQPKSISNISFKDSGNKIKLPGSFERWCNSHEL